MSLWKYANPVKFMAFSGRILPVCTLLASICMLTGLVWGFFYTSDDFKQGSTVKIIFLHVPSALMAINIWLMMLVTSFIWLIRRHHISALAARAAAPIGLIMTLIAIFTGAIWGKPMWGTYWAWDSRLTSFMILLIFYFGYIALWQAIEDDDVAADLTSILCMVGSVFALLSRYSVNLWSQGQHQGATLTLFRRSPIDASYYYPLLICISGFFFLFVTLVLVRTRTHIRRRRTRALLSREARI